MLLSEVPRVVKSIETEHKKMILGLACFITHAQNEYMKADGKPCVGGVVSQTGLVRNCPPGVL